MLERNLNRILLLYHKSRLILLVLLCLLLFCSGVKSCSPGRSGARRRSTRKLTPLVFKQHVPNLPENSYGASGPPEGRIWRDDVRFRNLVPNYNTDIVFKDEEGTGVDRLMTIRCKERLDILAISVMNMWPGIRLRVTEGFDEEGHHPKNSLHYEGRAVHISTSDRDISKYGMLARLAVDAGFDWVFYESRTHIYCSVKTESTVPSRFSGCFHGSSQVITQNGIKRLQDISEGENVLSTMDNSTPLFSKVIGFLHRDPHHVTAFVELRTSSNVLHVTGSHLVFNGQKAIQASYLNVGDSLMTLFKNESLLESELTVVRHVNMSGVYAPLTESGTIVVNGVLSSCYAVIDYHDLAHYSFLPLRLIYKTRDSVPSFIHDIYSLLFEWIWPPKITKMKINTRHTEKTEIHWYAKLLCRFTSLFVTVC